MRPIAICDKRIAETYIYTDGLFQVGSSGIEASWAGGNHGRQVIDRLLPEVTKFLSEHGVFYMVVIKENNIGQYIITFFFHLNIAPFKI